MDALVSLVAIIVIFMIIWSLAVSILEDEKRQQALPKKGSFEEIRRERRAEAERYKVLEKATLIQKILGDKKRHRMFFESEGLIVSHDGTRLVITQGKFVVFESTTVTYEDSNGINVRFETTSFHAGPWLERLDSLYADARQRDEEQKHHRRETAEREEREKFGVFDKDRERSNH